MATNSRITGVKDSHSEGLNSELWRHPAPETSQMWDFLQRANKEQGLHMKSYGDLHQWSIDHVADFWAAVWEYTGVVASAQYEEVHIQELWQIAHAYLLG